MKKIAFLFLFALTPMLFACGNKKNSLILSSSDLPSSDFSNSEDLFKFSFPDTSYEETSYSSIQDTSFYEVSNYYDGYYSNIISWENGEDLKNQLYTLLRQGYHSLNYDHPNWESNQNADHCIDDFEYLDVIYSNDNVNKNETQKTWQREHAFCASLMCGSTTGNAVKNLGRATDFHNLFAASSSANSSRGNKNFGEVNKNSPEYVDRTTNNGLDGYSFDNKNFEPGDKDKGRLARAIFYMATMYKEDEVDVKNNINMKGLTIQEEYVDFSSDDTCKFAIGNLSTLLKWNNFAIDDLEMQHNVSVYQDKVSFHSTNIVENTCQGNRNPYIDYPELVDYVYGDKKEQPGELKYLTPSIVNLNRDGEGIHNYAIYSAKREYGFGDMLKNNDITLYTINNDFSYQPYSQNYQNTLMNHIFDENDGDEITNLLVIDNQTISYKIILNPMIACCYNQILNKGNVTTKKDVSPCVIEQSVKYGDLSWQTSFSFPYGTTTQSFSNISTGGFKIGSSTAPVDEIHFKSVDELTLDRIYLKAFSANNSSYYRLSIKVNDNYILTDKGIDYNNKTYGIYGIKLNELVTGEVELIIKGNSTIQIHSLAVNIF